VFLKQHEENHIQGVDNLTVDVTHRLWSAPTTVNRWTLATFQARILKICGNLRRYKDRWILSLPTWWPYRTIIKGMIERCEARVPI
jgi:hypothetical protein